MRILKCYTLTAVLTLSFFSSHVVAQGPLSPTSAPAPTMKTLDQVEPRMPISSLPYTCAVAGVSYYVTGNLTSSTDGIWVRADDITIDLSGFHIKGEVASSWGVYANVACRNIRIRNGSIFNWGFQGIDIDNADHVTLEDLTIYSNGWGGATRDGVELGNDSVMRRCRVIYNATYGVEAGSRCRFEDCVMARNEEDGVYAGWGLSVERCRIENNGDDGIEAGSSFRIVDTICRMNAEDGIQVANEGVLLRNTCNDNGTSSIGAGIHVTGTDCTIEDNQCIGNDRGLAIDTSGNHVKNNTVKGNTENYVIAAGNQLHILLCEIPENIRWPARVTLAGTLTCSETGTNGLTIVSDDVTVDLAGHTLIGPGADSGHGIYHPFGAESLTVINGTVKNWKGTDAHGGAFVAGIAALGTGSLIEEVKSINNYNGMRVYANAVIRDALFEDNDQQGLSADNECVIQRCVSRNNVSDGFYLGHRTHISDSIAMNCAYGFSGAGNDSQYLRCIARECAMGYLVRDSIVRECIAAENDGDGIRADNDCIIEDNQCRNNGADGSGAGIHITGSDNRIRNNHLLGADYGLYIEGTGNLVDNNTVKGNTDNYNIAAGNQLHILLCEIPENIEWPSHVTLPGTLTCTETGTNGLTLLSDDVTVDLAGHTLVGPGADSGHGIYHPFGSKNLTVINGTVKNWKGTDAHGGAFVAGIAALGTGSLIEEVKSINNYNGMRVYANAVIRDALFEDNDQQGLSADNECVIQRCVSRNNVSDGFYLGHRTHISDSIAMNCGYGFSGAGNDSQYLRCIARDCVTGYLVNNAIVRECIAAENDGDGIRAGNDCVIENNRCVDNGADGSGAGIHIAGSGNRIEGNHVLANDWGINVVASTNLIVKNSAGQNTGSGTPSADYDFNGYSVTYGQIITSSGQISADPWANFSY